MPHAIIEFAHDIRDATGAELVACVHRTMNGCGLFELQAIKTRAYAVHDYKVGSANDADRFIHVTVQLLSGRTVEERKSLSDQMTKALRERAPGVEQITVEIRDMNRETYGKSAL